VKVRNARPGDGEALGRLWVEDALYYVELFPEDFRVPNQDGLVEDLENALARKRDHSRLWLVAEIDGEVVGQLGAHVEPPMENADRQMIPYLGSTRLFIDSLGTSSAYRRQGVASALVEAAEDWGRRKGAAVAILDTYTRSPVSVPFWEKRMHYSRRAIIFQKSLDSPPFDDGMQLRRYRSSDGPAVRRLHFEGLDQMGVNRPGPWDADLDQIEAEYLSRGEFLIAELEGQAVAMGGLRAVGADVGELKRLRVTEAYQRRGLGEAITRALMARARELGFKRLILDTTTEQAPAQALYNKLGFRETCRRTPRDLEIIFYERELEEDLEPAE